jgi:hypothetical protein
MMAVALMVMKGRGFFNSWCTHDHKKRMESGDGGDRGLCKSDRVKEWEDRDREG